MQQIKSIVHKENILPLCILSVKIQGTEEERTVRSTMAEWGLD
jgi:hypothetical protein